MKLLHSFIGKILKHRVASIFGLIGLKGIHFALLLYLTDCLSPDVHISPLSIYAGDTFSYIGAMENYVTEGSYYFDNGVEKVYTGRVPHYAVTYYLFRMAFDERTSMDLVVALQLIFECISIYFLALILYRITRNVYAFGAVLLLGVVASNATAMAFMLVPESFSCSLLIFALYFYVVYREERKMRDLVALAVMLGLLTTMKSYFVLLYAFVGWEIWAYGKYNMLLAVRPAVVLAAPLLLLLAPWVIRNYRVEHRFIPLQVNVYAGYNYKAADLAFRRYLRAWGGDFVLWEPKHAGCYFMPDPTIACTFVLPEYVYTARYGAKEVESIRQRFIQFHKQYTPAMDSALTREFDLMAEDYREEKPFRFYFVSPLLLAKQFVIHSGSYYLPIYSNSPCYHPVQMGVKVVESLVYVLGVFVGIPGLALMSWRRKGVLFGVLPWILIILFPVVLGFAEARYIRTVEPVFYLGVVYVGLLVVEKVFGRKLEGAD